MRLNTPADRRPIDSLCWFISLRPVRKRRDMREQSYLDSSQRDHSFQPLSQQMMCVCGRAPCARVTYYFHLRRATQVNGQLLRKSEAVVRLGKFYEISITPSIISSYIN